MPKLNNILLKLIRNWNPEDDINSKQKDKFLHHSLKKKKKKSWTGIFEKKKKKKKKNKHFHPNLKTLENWLISIIKNEF